MEVNAFVKGIFRTYVFVVLYVCVSLPYYIRTLTSVYNVSIIDLPVDASTIERRAIPRLIQAMVFLLKQIVCMYIFLKVEYVCLGKNILCWHRYCITHFS